MDTLVGILSEAVAEWRKVGMHFTEAVEAETRHSNAVDRLRVANLERPFDTHLSIRKGDSIRFRPDQQLRFVLQWRGDERIDLGVVLFTQDGEYIGKQV